MIGTPVFLTTKPAKITKTAKAAMSTAVRLAAEGGRRDVRRRKYKPLLRRQRLVFACSYIAAVGVLSHADQSNSLGSVRLRVKTVTSVKLRDLQ